MVSPMGATFPQGRKGGLATVIWNKTVALRGRGFRLYPPNSNGSSRQDSMRSCGGVSYSRCSHGSLVRSSENKRCDCTRRWTWDGYPLEGQDPRTLGSC